MKIKYSSGEEEDTKDMTDIKAHIYESIQTLMDVLKTYDASFYMAVMFPQGDKMALTGAQRFKSSQEIAVLLEYIEKQFISSFGLKIVPLEEPPDEEPKIIEP